MCSDFEQLGLLVLFGFWTQSRNLDVWNLYAKCVQISALFGYWTFGFQTFTVDAMGLKYILNVYVIFVSSMKLWFKGIPLNIIIFYNLKITKIFIPKFNACQTEINIFTFKILFLCHYHFIRHSSFGIPKVKMVLFSWYQMVGWTDLYKFL